MKRICMIALVLTLCFSLALSAQAQQTMLPLSGGDGTAAYGSYVDPYDDYTSQTTTYGSHHSYDSGKEPFNILMNLGICLAIGFVIALIVTGIMKGKLKSVHAQSGASDYVKAGSLNVTHRQDLFLYREIRKVEKPKSNDGPGRSRGGRF